ncbi:uncharacterized protein SPPG_01729 [Spizellomyces punctatus DAOM BR117]|uniref:Enoyl-CoA hydratase/isomerase n=1 Tax=Spizellomyces punctatus (strain DAOM BR117) TaxID=645134 RepID=A0A0L0HMJ8_SPIPD|nr:uncharacterized protein SPPG_01729 [Spizellomyces punctatus DAOM BR117]KND02641.1 hypothetical protein SPPG_01729 [Spizellomyces punctatus DAOM BR117]|eukprot:XP_016610680.1 hypothetical protein SPPG_01729 [Spizellomyces punctatus DAOM BR117]
MAAFQTLAYSEADGIATITLNRPKHLNAFTTVMYTELPIALKRAADSPAVVLTLLTGAGRLFSSGADVTEGIPGTIPPLSDTDASREFYRRRFDGTIVRCGLALAEHPKVLVVALNGPVVGIAAALISHGDIIYAAESATLHAPFSSLAISPEGGSSFAFTQRLGYPKAMEALLFSRKFTAQELEAIGFVNKVFPLEGFQDNVRKTLLATIKTVVPASLITTKRLVKSNFQREQIASIHNEAKELTERFVSGDPQKVFSALAAKYSKSKL